MSKKVFVSLVVLVMLLAAVQGVFAINYGQPDGGEHPYVGLIVFDDAEGPAWRCTGTLVSRDVVLTAGHCTDGAVAARVWFQEDMTAAANSEYPFGGKTSYEGVPHPHPGFVGLTLPNTHDVGVVVLRGNSPRMSTYGVIASLGFLDNLKNQRGQNEDYFTVVGYGLQSVIPDLSALRIRMKGTSALINLTSALTDGYNLQTTNDPGQAHQGGTCSGDSGGPIFWQNTNIIVAINSFGLNANCVGNDFSYRTDIADSQNFLAGFGIYPSA